MASDLAGIGKIAESAELATREFRELFSLFCKPSVTEVGLWAGDWLHIQRKRQLARTFSKAKEMLDAAGVTIEPVPPKLLKPIADGCSLEEDEEMCDKWANLLAAAASGRGVSPLFVQTLASLSSNQASISYHS